MNEVTVNLLMAVLGNECKDYTYAKKFAFMVVSSRSTTQKTKEKARNIIDYFQQNHHLLKVHH